MPTPILATKLYIPPPRPRVVSRSRLIERLDEGLHAGRKLTLVSASAGSGKTTLISEWAAIWARRTPQVRAAWLSLDESDNDPARFLAYLVAALQTLEPEAGKGVLGALQSAQPPPLDTLLTSLLNEIAGFQGRFILVLDDYHVIEAKPVDDALAFLLEHQPPHIHLVVSTREDPRLPLARFRARGCMTELRAADLRFTPSEAAEFLGQAMGLTLSAEDAAALETRTEGWIAGLQLAALSMRGHEDAAGFIESFTGSHHFVLDYLLQEVLQRQPDDIQAFLLRTSILDRLCGPLCDAVTLDPSASGQNILEYLERANLFVVPLDNERRWFRYHHLFRDLLRQRLGQSTAASSTDRSSGEARLHTRASRWYEQNDFAAEAYRHALAAGDYERAAGIAEMARPAMDAGFQSAAWLGWVKALPDDVIRSRPVLSVDYGWALLDTGMMEGVETRLHDAESWLKASTGGSERPEGMVVVDEERLAGLPIAIALARSYRAQSLGDNAVAIEHARRALELMPEEDHLNHAQAAALLATTYWRAGDLAKAAQGFAECQARFARAGNLAFAATSPLALAYLREAEGRLGEAASIYRQSLEFAREHGEVMAPVMPTLHLGLGLILLEQGKERASAEHLQTSETLSRQAALPDWPQRWSLAQAQVRTAQGDLDGALDQLREAQRRYTRAPLPDVRPIAAQKARLWIRQGRLTEARNWAGEQGLAADDTLSYMREFEHITLARLLVAEYRNSHAESSILEATKLLERLLPAAEHGGRLGSFIETLILQALALVEQAKIPQALTPLERALNLAEPEGYVRIFVNEGNPMAQLLTRAKTQGIRPAYVDRLLDAFHTQPLMEPLSRRELEILRLIAQGLSNHEIGARLFLALDTVKGHNRRIFEKLQVQRRTEAVARARELGLV